MTHAELCEHARRWLSGTMRCDPVFSNCASCSEVPDAIGWSSRWKSYGSIVIECKTSHTDFLKDKRKAIAYRHPDRPGDTHGGRRIARAVALREGYVVEPVDRMGDYRYFMVEDGSVADVLDVAKHSPDHGLLEVRGRRIFIAREAPRRSRVDYPGEVRFLRFAIINGKKAHS